MTDKLVPTDLYSCNKCKAEFIQGEDGKLDPIGASEEIFPEAAQGKLVDPPADCKCPCPGCDGTLVPVIS
jgi:hypothetical protein